MVFSRRYIITDLLQGISWKQYISVINILCVDVMNSYIVVLSYIIPTHIGYNHWCYLEKNSSDFFLNSSYSLHPPISYEHSYLFDNYNDHQYSLWLILTVKIIPYPRYIYLIELLSIEANIMHCTIIPKHISWINACRWFNKRMGKTEMPDLNYMPGCGTL